MTTDQAATYPIVLDEVVPAAWHHTEQYANNRIEADYGRLKARLRRMRGLKQDRSASVIIVGHAFVQNLRRGHYGLAVEELANRRLVVAFEELALAIRARSHGRGFTMHWLAAMQQHPHGVSIHAPSTECRGGFTGRARS